MDHNYTLFNLSPKINWLWWGTGIDKIQGQIKSIEPNPYMVNLSFLPVLLVLFDILAGNLVF